MICHRFSLLIKEILSFWGLCLLNFLLGFFQVVLIFRRIIWFFCWELIVLSISSRGWKLVIMKVCLFWWKIQFSHSWLCELWKDFWVWVSSFCLSEGKGFWRWFARCFILTFHLQTVFSTDFSEWIQSTKSDYQVAWTSGLKVLMT